MTVNWFPNPDYEWNGNCKLNGLLQTCIRRNIVLEYKWRMFLFSLPSPKYIKEKLHTFHLINLNFLRILIFRNPSAHRVQVIQLDLNKICFRISIDLFPDLYWWKFSQKKIFNSIPLRRVYVSSDRNLKYEWSLLTLKRRD